MLLTLFIIANLLLIIAVINDSKAKSKTIKQDRDQFKISNKMNYFFSSKRKVIHLFEIFGPRPKIDQRNPKYKGYTVWWFNFPKRLNKSKRD